jgi:hypothetical protein
MCALNASSKDSEDVTVTVHCRVPKAAGVKYRYVEVVRKQHLRRQMDAFACLQCQLVLLFCHLSDLALVAPW